LLAEIKQQTVDQFNYIKNTTSSSPDIGRKINTYDYLQLLYHPELVSDIRKGDLVLTDITESLRDREIPLPEKSLVFSTNPDGSETLNGFGFQKENFANEYGALIAASNILYIPASVKNVADGAFRGLFSQDGAMPQIDTIEFQAGASVDIGSASFMDCDNISAIIFDGEGSGKAEIHNISDRSFSGCANLATAISYHAVGSDNDTKNAPIQTDGTTIVPSPVSTFAGCASLPGIGILFNDTDLQSGKNYYIGESEFAGCSVLSYINLPNGLAEVSSSAFSQCKTLGGSLELPNSVKEIGESAFSQCTSLSSIVLPSSLITIGNNAFSGCVSVTNKLCIPDNVTSIGSGAFFYTNLKFTNSYYTSTNETCHHK
jgi:hypothetical protein